MKRYCILICGDILFIIPEISRRSIKEFELHLFLFVLFNRFENLNFDELRVGRKSNNKAWTAKLRRRGNIYATTLFQGLVRISFGTHQTSGQIAHVKRFEPSLVNRRKRMGRYRGRRGRGNSDEVECTFVYRVSVYNSVYNSIEICILKGFPFLRNTYLSQERLITFNLNFFPENFSKNEKYHSSRSPLMLLILHITYINKCFPRVIDEEPRKSMLKKLF